eukprot:749489-Hanusia_phi.AAC.1
MTMMVGSAGFVHDAPGQSRRRAFWAGPSPGHRRSIAQIPGCQGTIGELNVGRPARLSPEPRAAGARRPVTATGSAPSSECKLWRPTELRKASGNFATGPGSPGVTVQRIGP